MSAFRRELAARQSDPPGRRWVFVPYDQLTAAIGPLAADEPRRLGIELVEDPPERLTHLEGVHAPPGSCIVAARRGP